MEKEIAAKIIVDLYEMRVSTFNRYLSKSDLVMDNYKYNFFSSAIAQLCSKYQITDREIDEEIRKRRLEEQKTKCVDQIISLFKDTLLKDIKKAEPLRVPGESLEFTSGQEWTMRQIKQIIKNL